MDLSFIDPAEVRAACERSIAEGLRSSLIHDALMKAAQALRGKKVTKKLRDLFEVELTKNADGEKFWDWAAYSKEISYSGVATHKLSIRRQSSEPDHAGRYSAYIDEYSLAEKEGELDVSTLQTRWDNAMSSVAILQAKLPGIEQAAKEYNDAVSLLQKAAQFAKHDKRSVYPLYSYFKD